MTGKDTRKVSEMEAHELEEMAIRAAKAAPQTFFKEACDNCFDKKAKALGEALTGRDVTKTADKDHVHGVFKHAELMRERSKLFGATVMIESIKWAGIVIALYLGLKK